MSVALSWGSSSGWLRVCRERLTFGEYVTCQALEGHSRQSPAALKGREGPPKSAPQYEAGKGEGSFCLSGTPPPQEPVLTVFAEPPHRSFQVRPSEN